MLPFYLYFRVSSSELERVLPLDAEPADHEVPAELRRPGQLIVKFRIQSPGAGSPSVPSPSVVRERLRAAGIAFDAMGAGVSTSRAA